LDAVAGVKSGSRVRSESRVFLDFGTRRAYQSACNERIAGSEINPESGISCSVFRVSQAIMEARLFKLSANIDFWQDAEKRIRHGRRLMEDGKNVPVLSISPQPFAIRPAFSAAC